ncbi:MAG: hypothetical protein K2O27_03580 [Candidatus Amulumruptor sp.]|nr:hypothetical protein [Candidatus Amulumruptor sp.]MDE6545769.1 hypothetical protein [Paramuribaculum sp.]MDE7151323.1 hypothetical protein [Candidatus Amulumruptor sp.]MDE7237530.1 hypothetical protein [Paramuribaculum sp.]
MVIKKIIAVLASVACVAVSAMAIDGSWRGELSLGPAKLPLVFHFTTVDVAEYGTITETIAPEVLDDICDFIIAL